MDENVQTQVTPNPEDGASVNNNEPSEYPDQQASDGNDPAQDNWEVRAKYHQSRADKLEAKLKELEAQLGNNPLEPIVNEIASNPEALKAALNAVQPQQQPGLQKPEKPKKPANYSRYEALNDPNSESAKYEEQLMEYQARLAEYYEERDRLREEEKQRIAMQQQQLLQQQQAVALLQQQVQAEHGMSAGEAAEFIQFLSSPESLDIQNLVRYYKFLKKSNNVARTPEPRKQEPGNAPIPPAAGSGKPSGGVDVEQDFIQGIQGQARDLFALK